MKPISLYTQRNLERFLSLAGIAGPQVVEGAMSFQLRDHQLHLELSDEHLSLLFCIPFHLDEAQLLTLWERVVPERFAGYLVRPLALQQGGALQITLPPVLTAEQLMRIYRALLGTLSPYGILK